MKEYDVIVIGSGSGTSIVETALNHDKDVALVDKGPLGGTCLNLGCIPSKLLIYPADVISKIKSSRRFGIQSDIVDIDFENIMENMRNSVSRSQNKQVRELKNASGLDLYNSIAKFVDDYTLSVEDEKIRGELVFLASGARPLIPKIGGLDEIDFLTNESILDVDKRPESIVIIGGGYISAEYGHFLNSVGVDVKIIQRNNYLVPKEETGISQKLEEVYNREMDIFTNTEAVRVEEKNDGYIVVGKDIRDSDKKEIEAEEIMVAAGRESNADLLDVEKTGVETGEDNYVKTNREMETSKENIWAIGDATGKEMFKHVANREASIAAYNGIHNANIKMDYKAVPHAVYSNPKIASVGLGEKKAKKQYNNVLVGKANYKDVAKGKAMREEDGFAKAIVEGKTRKILGFHIIGSYAPILIQEIVNAIANNVKVDSIFHSMHIHPAMSEIVTKTLGKVKEA